ncbi:hypothetical protein RRG08_031477 [Elysia crispata]|uniref:Uncharacterized protein n=1 Tax=Elysia crispata TaxID=231223 RepID=A0AAE0ZNJ3_9GAST|nr:hypothetical protein RRG08_031477 [Elysia crispata]
MIQTNTAKDDLDVITHADKTKDDPGTSSTMIQTNTAKDDLDVISHADKTKDDRCVSSDDLDVITYDPEVIYNDPYKHSQR